MSHRTVLAPACCLFLGLALLGFALASPRPAASAPAAASAPEVTATPPIALALGMSHSCALIDGGVRCWGFGPLTGIAGGNDQPVPVQVAGLSSGVQAVVAGHLHTCALLGDGTVRCWGRGGNGQLGNGAGVDSATPVAVIGLTGVRKLAAGYDHTCALLDGGRVRCWGLNANGQLGGGGGVGSTGSVPVAVVGLSGVLSLTGGGAHTCALMPAGSVKCWGYGFYGSLGNGSNADHNTPVDVTGLTGASQITAGYLHSCALVSGGGVKCWGQFASLWTSVPADVAGFANPTALAAHGGHLCALSGEGGVSCFGANTSGQLGDGTTTDRNAPVPVTDLGGLATGIAAGAGHTCATLADGNVRCWGGDAYGQLGTGNATRGIAALGELSGSAFSAISVGNLHVCGVTAGGKAQCWGRDYNGELGIGAVQAGTAYASPQDVTGLSGGVSAIAAGIQYSCAVVNGAAKCWGRNEYGVLGDGTTGSRNTPVGVTGLGSGVSAIAVSSSAEGTHTCAVANGGAKCWGNNYLGQLGNGNSGSTTPQTTPVDVSGLSAHVTQVTAGGRHSCAVVSGAVKCWGYGYYGQLGNGTSGSHTPVPTPVTVSGLAGVTALTAGDDFTCAIANGAAKCWGRNNKGQLGDNSWTDRSTPVQVQGLTSGVTSISAWHTQACAVKAGAVYCWGDAVYPYPSSISWAASGYTGAAAGDVRCGWGSAGTTCWGTDVDGKLGVGRLLFRSKPAPAMGLKPGAEVFLHHNEARPDSLVNLRGANFPAWAFVPLRANGRSLGSAQANDKGYLSMVVKTAGAPAGFYQLEALANGIPIAAPLTLGGAAPLRKAEGAGTIIPLAGAVIATPPPPTPTPAPGQQAPSPQISQVAPDRGAADAPAQVEVHGANFQPGAVVRLDGSPAANTLYNSADHLTALLPGGLAPGLHSITVVNPDWRQVTLPNAYTAILVVASPQAVQQDLHGVGYELTSENLTESVGTPTRIWFAIHRLGGTGALINVPVRFYVGAPGLTDPSTQATYIAEGAAPSLLPNRSSYTAVNWTPAATGSFELYAVIDPANAVAEADEGNNVVHAGVQVKAALPVDQAPPEVDAVVGPGVTSSRSVALEVTAHDPPDGSGLGWVDFVIWEYFPALRAWLVTDESGWLPCSPGVATTFYQDLGYFAGPRWIDVWAADKARNVSDAPRSVIVNYVKPDDFILQGDSQLFLFPLAPGQPLSASLAVSFPGDDADLYLWPPDYPGRNYWFSAQDGMAPEHISVHAPVSGYYWLEVYGYRSSFYNLTVSAGATEAVEWASAEATGPLLAKPPRTQVASGDELPPRHTGMSRVLPQVYLPLVRR